MAQDESGPKFISQHKRFSLFVIRLEGREYDELVAQLPANGVLYALFDRVKTSEQIQAEKAEITAAPEDDIFANAPIQAYETVFMRIDSLEELAAVVNTGWAWFYSVPDWFAKEASLA